MLVKCMMVYTFSIVLSIFNSMLYLAIIGEVCNGLEFVSDEIELVETGVSYMDQVIDVYQTRSISDCSRLCLHDINCLYFTVITSGKNIHRCVHYSFLFKLLIKFYIFFLCRLYYTSFYDSKYYYQGPRTNTNLPPEDSNENYTPM